MVGTRSEVVLMADLRSVIGKCTNVAGWTVDSAGVRQRIKREIRDDCCADRVLGFARACSIDTEQTAASVRVRDIARDVDPLVLAEPFIVPKDKSAVVNDRAACGGAKLIAAEFGDLSGEVELIASIESAIAKKLIDASM